MKKMLTGVAVFAAIFLSAFSAAGPDAGYAGLHAQILDEVNDLRSKGCKCGNRFMPPAPPLRWNDQLENSAYVHARDMRRHSFFSHTGSDGSSITQRIKRQGYIGNGNTAYYVAENIAYGYPTVKRVFYEWRISTGHCLNMMNPKLTDMGVAELDKYWVQDFGYRR